jgi:hypothetical protein
MVLYISREQVQYNSDVEEISEYRWTAAIDTTPFSENW